MKQPNPDAYLRLFADAMPDPATTVQRVSAVIALVQDAKAAIQDDLPENRKRAEVALTVALGALTLLGTEFAKTAEWVSAVF